MKRSDARYFNGINVLVLAMGVVLAITGLVVGEPLLAALGVVGAMICGGLVWMVNAVNRRSERAGR